MRARSTFGRVPFGLRDGKLRFVTEVETGLACNCVCPDPACSKPLVARNKASVTRKRVYHFQHAASSTGCGGWESAMHRMAKEVVQRATRLMLPDWSACEGDLQFPHRVAMLAPGGTQEVALGDAQMRPDVRVIAVADQAFLPALYVEIKVSHAVDWEKRQRVIDGGYTMMEIDLADIGDDVLQDEEAFATQVLDCPENRKWVNISSAPFLARMLGQEIVQIASQKVQEKRVPTKKGNTLILQTQDYLSYTAAREDPVVDRAELADTWANGQRVDGLGNPLPYAPGLYTKTHVPGGAWHGGDHYKTHLRPIVHDIPENQQKVLRLV